jgi:hypothetical protein
MKPSLKKFAKSEKKQINPEVVSETNLIWKFIGNLPVTLGVALAGFSAVTVSLLLLESFRTPLILGIGMPVAFILFYVTNRSIIPESPSSLRERRVFDLLAIVLVIGWGVFNSAYNAQTVYLYRDPGLYNTTARWLMDHDNIVIPATNPFGENNQLRTTSNAGVNTIKEDESRLYTHGQRLLPTLTAGVGRVTQEAAALKTNVVIGALALLAVYGFIRLFSKPRWALLVTTVLGMSLPMLYFSRDMYTEPLSMLFIFTMLSFVYYAKRTEKAAIWVLAGIVAGVTTMTRIDAYLGLAGLFIYLVSYLLVAKNRTKSLINVSVFLSSFSLTAIVAWLDLTQLGTAYYRFHEDLISMQLVLLASIIASGMAVVFVSWKTRVLGKITNILSIKALKRLSVIIIGIVAIVLFSRPLIVDGTREYEVQKIGGTESIVLQTEKTQNSITYDLGERVILWPVWYLGALLCFFGLIGLFIMSNRLWNDESLLLIPFFLSFLSVATLYFFSPSITRDHIWASRRILPLIMPGIVFLAAYVLNLKTFRSKGYSLLYYISVLIIFGTAVLNTSGFFLKERTNDPLLTQVNDFCEILPDDSAVLLVGIFGLVGTQTVHSYCRVPTVRYLGNSEPTRSEFVDFYYNAVENGYVPVVASFYNDRGLFASGSRVTDLDKTNYKTVKKVFSKAPGEMVKASKQITMGILNSDGRVKQEASLNNKLIRLDIIN